MRLHDWISEIGCARWWTRALGMGALMGVVFGVLGPFGSFLNGNIMLRMFSWTVNIVGGTTIIGLLLPPLVRLGLRLKVPLPAALAVGLLVVNIPVSLFCAAFGYWLWPRMIDRVRPEEWYSQSLLIGLFLVAVWVLLNLALRRTHPPLSPATPPSVDSREPVLCLQMEDHYVRIHRPSGSTLELMPLREAIERYGSNGGVKVHRSWWVSATAVEASERDARNLRLRLSNGVRVPVARNRIAEVRARGWLSEE